jgi:hypothetical protein
MSDALVLSRLRQFLLVVSALLLIGTLVELWLINHMEDPVQLIPFALCGLGLVAVFVALLRPRRAALHGLRVLLALGSFLGVYLHLESNHGFQRELHPNASTGELLLGTLGGANPLLAPGMLAITAALAIAATYQHPAFGAQGRETGRA